MGNIEKNPKNINESETKEKTTRENNEEKKLEIEHEKKQLPKKRKIFPFILIGILIIAIIIFSVIFALLNIGNDKIIGKVSIMGIDVSNRTKEQATEALEDIVHDKMSEELILKKDDYECKSNKSEV